MYFVAHFVVVFFSSVVKRIRQLGRQSEPCKLDVISNNGFSSVVNDSQFRPSHRNVKTVKSRAKTLYSSKSPKTLR